MKLRLFSLVALLIMIVTLSSCGKGMREPNTPAETCINMMMSLESGDFDGFKSYMHDNLKSRVTQEDFNKLKNIMTKNKYSVDTYVIMELENGEVLFIRVSSFKEKNKDVVYSIKLISKDMLDTIKKLDEDNGMDIKF